MKTFTLKFGSEQYNVAPVMKTGDLLRFEYATEVDVMMSARLMFAAGSDGQGVVNMFRTFPVAAKFLQICTERQLPKQYRGMGLPDFIDAIEPEQLQAVVQGVCECVSDFIRRMSMTTRSTTISADGASMNGISSPLSE